MLRLLLLLISSLVSIYAHGGSTTDSVAIGPGTLTYDGFVYFVMYSDRKWQKNEFEVGYNAIYSMPEISSTINSQIVLNSNNLLDINRLTFEHSGIIESPIDYAVAGGIFARVPTFYNLGLDTPGSNSIATLPQGMYPTRLLSVPTFTTMLGVSTSLFYRQTLTHSFTELQMHLGKPIIGKQKELQLELLSMYTPDIEIKNSDKTDYDIYLGHTTVLTGGHLLKLYVARSSYSADLKAKTNSLLATYLSKEYQSFSFDMWRHGVSYTGDDWYVTYEQSCDYVRVMSPLRKYSLISKSVTAGKEITDKVQAYISASREVTDLYTETLNEKSIGITWDPNLKTTLSLQYSVGNGSPWVRYDNFLSKDTWKSVVLSGTYRF